MREIVDVYLGEIIITIGMIILITGVLAIIKLFARHSRGMY